MAFGRARNERVSCSILRKPHQPQKARADVRLSESQHEHILCEPTGLRTQRIYIILVMRPADSAKSPVLPYLMRTAARLEPMHHDALQPDNFPAPTLFCSRATLARQRELVSPVNAPASSPPDYGRDFRLQHVMGSLLATVVFKRIRHLQIQTLPARRIMVGQEHLGRQSCLPCFLGSVHGYSP